MANETIVINDDLRTMQIPSSITLLGVESDEDVNKIPFQMPKEYCGFDLSQFEARINYLNANGEGDMYIVDDLEIDGDDPSLMTFTWLVGRNACAYKGNVQFIVCLKKFDNDQNVVQEFNTTVYSLPVLEGLETTELIVQQNPDIIEHILQLIEQAAIVDFSNYYTKAETNALKLANPYPLIINGTEYDGSAEVEMTIEGGSSSTVETASGTIVHVTDAVANEALESMALYDSNDDPIVSANIAVANKNLFRLDLIAEQTVSKGITFEKNSQGAIHATGTSTGTYAATQCAIDKNAFVVGETYTISSGKTSGILYVQLILNYMDGTTDYLVASNTPYTFTLAKPVSSVVGSVQITASGVTVDEWIYPMIELSDAASQFVNNAYASMTFNGSTMPVLPDSISNIWSNDDAVNNIVIEYQADPIMAKVNELEKEFYNTIQHDDQLDSNSEKAVQNKVVTAELMKKITYPSGGQADNVLVSDGQGNAFWKSTDPVLSVEEIIHENVRKCFKSWEVLRDMSLLTLQNGQHRTGVVYRGDIEEGLPYSSVFWNDSDILWNRNLATFYSAMLNPASIVYQGSVFEITQNKTVASRASSNYYGTMCSGLAGKLLGCPIYYTTGELDVLSSVFEKLTYTGADMLEVGMPMLMDGHVALVYDVIRSDAGKVIGVAMAEEKKPVGAITYYSIADFEKKMRTNGYVLGRYIGVRPTLIPDVQYATDVIPEFGDKTWYKQGSEIWVYIPDSSVTVLYHKKSTDASYTAVNLSSLASKTVNGVTVYNVSSMMANVGTYYLTTHVDSNYPCQISIVNTGSIIIDNETKTARITGFSSNLTPLWYQVNYLVEEDSTHHKTTYAYPAPDGYCSITDRGNKHMLNGATEFSFTKPFYLSSQTDSEDSAGDDVIDEGVINDDEELYKGYSIIVHFENEFGMPSANAYVIEG